MTIQISIDLEKRLQHLAGQSGRPLDALVEEAIRNYLDSATITDVTPDEVAAAQMKLVGEMNDSPAWGEDEESSDDEAR